MIRYRPIMNSEYDWERLVANPEAFGEAEKSLWKQIYPVLDKLLDELKANDRIETVYTKTDMDQLGVVLSNLDDCGRNYNKLMDSFEPRQKFERLMETAREFGITEEDWVKLFLEVSALSAVLPLEFFRTLLIFLMKDIDPKLGLGQLLNELENVAPTNGSKIRPFVESDFRNALAHGLFGIKNKKMVLYKNAKLELLDELDLADFIMKMKSQNVLSQCLVKCVADKVKKGFFLPNP